MQDLCYLMNKDTVLAEFVFTEMGTPNEDVEVIHSDTFIDVRNWVKSRVPVKHRKAVKDILRELGLFYNSNILRVTKGLSLTDSLWVRFCDDSSLWKEINLYSNDFDPRLSFASMGIPSKLVKSIKNMPEVTTNGTFGKCWIRDNDDVFLIKDGYQDNGVETFAPYSEVVSSLVYSALDGRSVEYSLGTYADRVVSKCKLFTTENIGYAPMSAILNNPLQLEELVSFFDKLGYADMFINMIIADTICLNVDRHYGNFGCYSDNESLVARTMAPIFDFNMSYMIYTDTYKVVPEAMEKYLTKSAPAIGHTWFDCKSYISSGIRSKLINLKDLYLTILCDSEFTDERLRKINVIKNVMIDRLLGRNTEFKF